MSIFKARKAAALESERRYFCGFCQKVRVAHPADNCKACGVKLRRVGGDR